MSLYRHNPLDHLGFTAVVGLAFVLAMGFLLVILSCALWANWLPLLVGEWDTGPRYYLWTMRRVSS